MNMFFDFWGMFEEWCFFGLLVFGDILHDVVKVLKDKKQKLWGNSWEISLIRERWLKIYKGFMMLKEI